VAEAREQLERAVDRCEAVEALGRRERREQLPDALDSEEMWRDALNKRTAVLEQMQAPGTEVRRERELAEQLLARRAAQALAAARIEPPSYIAKELGERPAEPAKARVWDQGVREFEGYRLEHGVTDTARVFGPKLPEPGERLERRNAERRLADHQRRLELEHRREIREPRIELDIGGPGL
jgi:hypothetical protein